MSTTTQSDRARTTLTLNKENWQQFSRLIKAFKMRRDSFLNGILDNEIDELELIPPNSRKAEAFIRDWSGRGGLGYFEEQELERVNMTLDKAVLQRMNSVCAEKRVPRDVFMDAVIDFLLHGATNGTCGSPLHTIRELLENPRRDFGHVDGKSAHEELAVSDEEMTRREKMFQEQPCIVEAIARLKNISRSSAAASFEQYSEREKDAIASNPQVKRIVEEIKLKARDAAPVDLDALLQLKENKKR